MWKYILLSTLLFIFTSVGKCFAESPQVYISQVMWNGSSVSSADEWIELYNPTEEVVDLEKWKIFDDVKGEAMIEINSGQIPPKGYFLISNNSKDHIFTAGESILNIDPDIVSSDVSLSNDKLKISLQNKDDETIDIAGNGLRPFFYKLQTPKASMIRVSACADGTSESCWELATQKENLDSVAKEFATPRNSGAVKILDFKLEIPIILSEPTYLKFTVAMSASPESLTIAQGQNVINVDEFYKTLTEHSFEDCPTFTLLVKSKSGLTQTKDFSTNCAQLSGDIFISETMPDPSTGDEWVELANGGDKELNLNGWYLSDLSGKRYLMKDVRIGPFSYIVIYSSASKMILNNADEQISLWDPFGGRVDAIEWKSSSPDCAVAKWGEGTYETSYPTPGKENKIILDGKATNIDKPSKLDNSLGKKITAELSNIGEEKGFVTGEILGSKVVVKYDKQIDTRPGSRYTIESVVESDNPLIIRLLSIKLIDENENTVLLSDKEVMFTKVTKTKITTKRTLSKKKIKGIKALERPPNGSNNSSSMVELLVVIIFCYCGVIYAIYSRE